MLCRGDFSSLKSFCRHIGVSLDDLDSYAKIVDFYIRHLRSQARQELDWFRKFESLDAAVEAAALSKFENGKMHPHQYRVGHAVLAIAATALKSVPLQKARTFDELYDLVNREIRRIDRIGDLAVYDISHRIAAYRGLEPQTVYLHRGAKEGARALGVRGVNGRATIDMFPSEFRNLRPYELEDCLCQFKSQLRQVTR